MALAVVSLLVSLGYLAAMLSVVRPGTGFVYALLAGTGWTGIWFALAATVLALRARTRAKRRQWIPPLLVGGLAVGLWTWALAASLSSLSGLSGLQPCPNCSSI